jgi:hypothetical protein
MTPLKLLDLAHASLHGGNGPSLGGGVEGHASALSAPRLPPRLTLSQRSMVIWMPLARHSASA